MYLFASLPVYLLFGLLFLLARLTSKEPKGLSLFLVIEALQSNTGKVPWFLSILPTEREELACSTVCWQVSSTADEGQGSTLNLPTNTSWRVGSVFWKNIRRTVTHQCDGVDSLTAGTSQRAHQFPAPHDLAGVFASHLIPCIFSP